LLGSWPGREGKGWEDGEGGEADRPGEGLPERGREGVVGGRVLEDEGEDDGAEHAAELLQEAVGAAGGGDVVVGEAAEGDRERGELDRALSETDDEQCDGEDAR
jgi:hypothetical protein